MSRYCLGDPLHRTRATPPSQAMDLGTVQLVATEPMARQPRLTENQDLKLQVQIAGEQARDEAAFRVMTKREVSELKAMADITDIRELIMRHKFGNAKQTLQSIKAILDKSDSEDEDALPSKNLGNDSNGGFVMQCKICHQVRGKQHWFKPQWVACQPVIRNHHGYDYDRCKKCVQPQQDALPSNNVGNDTNGGFVMQCKICHQVRGKQHWFKPQWVAYQPVIRNHHGYDYDRCKLCCKLADVGTSKQPPAVPATPGTVLLESLYEVRKKARGRSRTPHRSPGRCDGGRRRSRTPSRRRRHQDQGPGRKECLRDHLAHLHARQKL